MGWVLIAFGWLLGVFIEFVFLLSVGVGIGRDHVHLIVYGNQCSYKTSICLLHSPLSVPIMISRYTNIGYSGKKFHVQLLSML